MKKLQKKKDCESSKKYTKGYYLDDNDRLMTWGNEVDRMSEEYDLSAKYTNSSDAYVLMEKVIDYDISFNTGIIATYDGKVYSWGENYGHSRGLDKDEEIVKDPELIYIAR